MEKTNDVIGLGNALMDFLVEIDDNRFLEFNLKKGEMHLVGEEKAKEVLQKLNMHQLSIETVPGGSTANVIKGVAFLGGNGIFCGKVGDDGHGQMYVQEMQNHGVTTKISKHNSTTGHAITFITPDSERTFSTYLGAAIQLAKEDVLEEDIQTSKVLYLQGYQLEGPTRETVKHAAEIAKRHNTLVALDLSDPGLIRRTKDFLEHFIFNNVDIIFVNENEAKEFTGKDNEEEALRELARYVKYAVVKIGERGSIVCANGVVTKVNPLSANAIDTTGAGDSYAAGFLFGFCKGWDVEKAGKLGSHLAARVVEQKGVSIKNLNRNEFSEYLGESVVENSEIVEPVEVEDSNLEDNEVVNQDETVVEEKEEVTVYETSSFVQEKEEEVEEENNEVNDIQENNEVNHETNYFATNEDKPSFESQEDKEDQKVEVYEEHEDECCEDEECQEVKVGIIGGSGLDNPNILQNAQDVDVDTPYGMPSSPLKVGKISGIDVVLIARHGREHTIPPTQVNFRANIHALKEAGCTHILATTACGSLREEIGRGDFVILDQFIDFTRHRPVTFHEKFEGGNIAHTPMATPFSEELREVLNDVAAGLGLKHHKKGTVITIEGPRFSTKAESHMFRAWGADVINMSVAPEAVLANEAGIPYAAVAMSTDYDWKENEKPVTWEEVLEVFRENVEKVTGLLMNAIPRVCGKCCVKDKIVNPVVDEVEENEEEYDFRQVIRTVPHWPKPGVMFRDITSLLLNPEAFDQSIKKFKKYYSGKGIQKIAGIESRGFIFGAALAREMGLPFVIIRKPGKLPGETVSEEYQLEYGTDKIEVHRSDISFGENILVIDDLIATGGTSIAACNLIEKLGAKVASIAFVVDLPELGGKQKLSKYDVFTLVEFEGE